MKTVFITFLFIAFLPGSVPAKAQSTDELNRLSKMIVQAKPQAEIMKSWESLVKRSPRMDVDKTISIILTAAKEENEKSRSTATYERAAALISGLQKKMHEDAMRVLANLKS